MSNEAIADLDHMVTVGKGTIEEQVAAGGTNIRATIINESQYVLTLRDDSIDPPAEWVERPPLTIAPGERAHYYLTGTGNVWSWLYYSFGDQGGEIAIKTSVPAVGANEFAVVFKRVHLRSEVTGDLRGWNVSPVFTIR